MALVALGLFAALGAGALEHLQHAFEPASPIHTEASHPGAAAHFEREVHLDGEGCPLCLHTRHPYVGPGPTTCPRSGADVRLFRPVATVHETVARSSASPRGPPR